MDVKFKFNEAEKPEPIVIEQVFAEKPAGGLVANPTFDVPTGTAVGLGTDGKYYPIKGYRVVKDETNEATTIRIAKGSGIENGDVLGVGGKSVACTAVDKSNAEYDLVTVTLGVAVKAGNVLFQSGSAKTSNATPIYTPVYVTGGKVYAGEGDQAVRLINGGNLRKETANVGEDIVKLMKSIALV